MRLVVGLAAFVLAAGCTSRRMTVSSAPPTLSSSAYVDLQPEWRIRVLFPILESGKFIVDTSGEMTSGTTFTLQTGADFLGYETAYYLVTRRKTGGVGIHFQSASITRDGVTHAEPVSRHPLFLDARRFRHIRLLYLKRSSDADHDMAVIGANRPDQISDLTRRIQTDPASCTILRAGFCEWIPRGISVLPEQKQLSGNAINWVPAN